MNKSKTIKYGEGKDPGKIWKSWVVARDNQMKAMDCDLRDSLGLTSLSVEAPSQ